MAFGIGSFGEVNSDAQSEAELLKMIADPAAAAKRLEELSKKAEEAKVILEQAKAENQNVIAARQEAEDFNKATLALVANLKAKEDELRAREEALAGATLSANIRADKLYEAEAAIAEQKAAQDAEIVARAAKVRELEYSAAERLKEAEAIKATAENNAKLEEELKAKLDSIKYAEDQATKKNQELLVAIEAARQTQESFEKRIAAVRLAAEA